MSAGQTFIFYTLKHFNSLVLATITTTRKFFTILASVFLFGHALISEQWIGVALVFLGLVLELYQKYNGRCVLWAFFVMGSFVCLFGWYT